MSLTPDSPALSVCMGPHPHSWAQHPSLPGLAPASHSAVAPRRAPRLCSCSPAPRPCWKPLLLVGSRLLFLQVSDPWSLPCAISPPLSSTRPAAWTWSSFPAGVGFRCAIQSALIEKTPDSLLTPADLPAFPPIPLTVSADSVACIPSFCPASWPSVLLNPSFSDRTPDVPEADAPAQRRMETEEPCRGLMLLHPGSQGRTPSVRLILQPYPLSPSLSLNHTLAYRTVWPLGVPCASASQPGGQTRAPLRGSSFTGTSTGTGLRMSVMSNTGEFSWALRLIGGCGLQEAIKRCNKKVKCSYCNSPDSHAAGKSCAIPVPPKLRLRARTFPRKDLLPWQKYQSQLEQSHRC